MENQPVQSEFFACPLTSARPRLAVSDLDAGETERKAIRVFPYGLSYDIVGSPGVGQALRLDAARSDRDNSLCYAGACPCADSQSSTPGRPRWSRSADVRVHVDDGTAHASASLRVSFRPCLPERYAASRMSWVVSPNSASLRTGVSLRQQSTKCWCFGHPGTFFAVDVHREFTMVGRHDGKLGRDPAVGKQ